MMLTKTEGRLGVPRDGRHCDLCGCSQPAVRCDKCGRQIFCLSCDDMYHRHPKRRFHLRKAVDTTPPTSMARPALPAKGHSLGGDPSKMPLPPPRKKKPGRAESFFSTFRRRSPSAESGNSPPLPKKEYSWTDRFGNIKKFMSNRPLPPLPPQEANGEESPQGAQSPSTKHDLSFIHKKVDDRPPQLPQRSLRPNEPTRETQQTSANGVREIRNGTLNHTNRNNGFGEENPWNNRTPSQPHPNTLMRQQGYMYPGSQGYSGAMSASATDLHSMEQPPMYPHFPPGYPPHYPMYPQGYPGYFGSSFADLSGHPTTTTDQDHSDDQSTDSSRPPPSGGGKRYQFRKRAKRSQSVMMDRMAYPGGQFFPFGPFPPGYPPGPWGAPPFGVEPPPPSPGRVRTRRRKKTTSEDDSSPLSRPSSSSGKQNRRPPVVTSSSSEDEPRQEAERSQRVTRKDSDPKKSPISRSPQVQHKKISQKQKKSDVIRNPDAEDAAHRQNSATVDRRSPTPSPPKDAKAGPSADSATPCTPADRWECIHCTYVNPAGNRICQVCCKTAAAAAQPPAAEEMRKSTPAAATPQPAAADSRPATSASEVSCSSPDKKKLEEELEEEEGKRRDMAVLNSALDEAEKEISRGLEELLKLKEDFPPSKPTPTPPQSRPESSRPPQTPPPPSKPVYKSSGKMRNANNKFIDKITNGSPPGSRCIETQTVETRRCSTSSTASDAYNSPVAQSPVMERAAVSGPWRSTRSTQSPDYERRTCGTSPSPEAERRGSGSQRRAAGKGPRGLRRTTSIQTDEYRTRGGNEEGGYFGGGRPGYLSPFERSYHPAMQRSHSRASLFAGRTTDLDYGGPMYRSVSRGSLTGDYPDNSFADFHNLRKPAYYLSMEELVERRRQETIRAQGLELVRMIREAEQQGFTADDIQVALQNCAPHQTPVEWLQDNWRPLAAEVATLCATYARDKRVDDVGRVSDAEAREALRMHKGDVWPAVTECVESRQRKFLELKSRGKFGTKDVTDALSANQGDVELAYAKLTAKSSAKPFLMRIWGAGEGVQNQDVPPRATPKAHDTSNYYSKDDVLSDETWDDDDVEWDEDEDEEQQGDIEDLHTCHEDIGIKTPDSDPSDYCDAYGSNTLERNASLPTPTEPEAKITRRGSFLSKLAGLKKNDPKRFPSPTTAADSNECPTEDGSSDQAKSYNPISVIKSTITAIRDSVGGGPKTDKKVPCVAPERRTIVVTGQMPHESSTVVTGQMPHESSTVVTGHMPHESPSGDASGVTLTSVKPLKESELITITGVSHEAKELPETARKLNVNQILSSDEKSKNKQSDLEGDVSGTSHEPDVQKINSSNDTPSTISLVMSIKNETSSEQDKKVKTDTIKSDKLSLKFNQDNNERDFKSVNNAQSLRKDTKENAAKDLTTPGTSIKPKKVANDENKEKFKGALGKESKIAVAGKKLSGEIRNTNSNSSKVPTQEDTLPILQNQTELKENRTITSEKTEDVVFHKPSTVLDEKSTEVDVLASGSKPKTYSSNETVLNARTEREAETSDAISIVKETASPNKGKKQAIKNCDTSEISSPNETENFVDESVHVTEHDRLPQKEETPFIDDVHDSLEARPGLNVVGDDDSPTFESMEPIHSSTFKRSFSNQNIEHKPVSEKESTESNECTSTTIVFKDVSVKNSLANEIQASGITEAGQSTSSDGTEIIDKNSSLSELNSSLKTEPQNVFKQNKEPHSKSCIDKPVAVESNSAISTTVISLQSSAILKETLKKDVSSNHIESENFQDTNTFASPVSAIASTSATNSTNTSLSNTSTPSVFSIASTTYTSAAHTSDSSFATSASTPFASITALSSADVSVISSDANLANASMSSTDNSTTSPTTSKNKTSTSIISASPVNSASVTPTSIASISNASENVGSALNVTNSVVASVSNVRSSPTYAAGESSILTFSETMAASSSASSSDASLYSKPSIATPFTTVTTNSASSIILSPSTTVLSILKDSTSDDTSKSSFEAASPTVTCSPNASVSISTSNSMTSLTADSISATPSSMQSTHNSPTSFTSSQLDTSLSSAAVTPSPVIPPSSAPGSPTALTATATVNALSSTPLASSYLVSKSSSEPTANSSIVTETSDVSAPVLEPTSTPKSDSTSINDTAALVSETNSLSTNVNSSIKDTLAPALETATLATSASTSIEDTSAAISKTVSQPTSASTSIQDTSVTASETTSLPTVTSIEDTSETASLPTNVPTSIEDAPATATENPSPPANLRDTPIAETGTTSSLPTPISDPDEESSSSDDDSSSLVVPLSPMDALRHRFEGLASVDVGGPSVRPASPFRRMSFRSRKEVIALERTRDSSVEKPWFTQKPKAVEAKKPPPKRSLKQQMETERRVRQLVADRKVRTYRKAEVVVQLEDAGFVQEEAVQAATECSSFEMALSYLQQECLLCAGHFPASHIVSMVHCSHKACRDCIRAYFTVQIRDRNIMELLCPFCNEPDITDDDVAQDYFNHLDMMLKKLVDPDIHELFQRKLRDRVLMRDPSFRWCSQCSSGFLAMENMTRLVCPDCNAVTCSSCRRPWEKEHQGLSCEAFASLKDGSDPEAQAVSLAKLLTEDGIDCPRCHFRYQLAKGGCMHFRCLQCQHDFCSGCHQPFRMGQKCGLSDFCAKLGLHAHHPRNCLFYLRDKDPQDLQRLLDMSGVSYDRDPLQGEQPQGKVCQVMEQKETADGMLDDCCGKEVEPGFAGLCRLHYVEYLGQLVNKHQVDPIQIFENDDLELVLRRANFRLPPKRYRESDESYRAKLVNLIHEELPLDKMDGS